MKTNKEVAREIITTYLSSIAGFNNETIAEMFLIKKDDSVLLEHIKSLKNIFEKAIEEIENELKESDE